MTEETAVEQEVEVTETKPEAKVKLDIKNVLEVLDASERAVALVGNVMKDGHLNWQGAAVAVIAEAKNLDVYVDAYKDADQIMAELKDLDETELLQIILKIYKLGKTVAEMKK